MDGKSSPTTRRLAASIVKFLQDSQKNGTLDSDEAEQMEVAASMISDSFGLDPNSSEPAVNLQQVFEVYEKTREKMVLKFFYRYLDTPNWGVLEAGEFGTVGSSQDCRSRTIEKPRKQCSCEERLRFGY